MNVHGLDAEQRRRLQATLARHRDSLDGIIKRMWAVGWYTDDPMLQTILAPRHALHAANNLHTTAKAAPSAECPA